MSRSNGNKDDLHKSVPEQHEFECDNETKPISEPKNTDDASTTSQVFFMIGCQRSGSNWLRTMLSEREDLIAPHPPHIMRDFMPRLEKYGDLSKQNNLKVCTE